jgi:hypothetical protein
MLLGLKRRRGQAESLDELLVEMDRLCAARRARPGPDVDRRLLSLRHRAALAMIAREGARAEYPAPESARFGTGMGIPEIRADELSPQLLRGAILSRGCLLVRGLVDPDQASGFRDEIDRAFGAREAASAGEPAVDGYFEDFVPDPRYDLEPHRINVNAFGGGMWVADSPRVAAELFDLLGRAGFLELASGYLGERAAISVNKSTLRRVKADPEADYSVSHWHQDGAFLGQVRALNMWLSLSHCGDVAPGLDLVSARIDHLVPTGTDGAFFDWSVSQAVAEEAAGDAGIARPVFEPGDAMLFDELFLHATGASRDMTELRYAVECWFFGSSAFPDEYPPLAS